jgi:hypothetical protein
MERRGSGPQATAGAPQLHSPPDCRGVQNFPDPATPHHIGPCSHCLLLPPVSGRIHPNQPVQGAAQMHCPSPKGGHHTLAPDKGDPRRLIPGTPPPSRWGHYKPGQPEEQSEGCQSISHPVGGSNHVPMQVFSQIDGHPFRLPTDTALGTFRTATGTSQVTGRDILEAVCQGARWDNLHLAGYDYTHIGTHSLHSRGATRMPGRFQQGRDPAHGPVVL